MLDPSISADAESLNTARIRHLLGRVRHTNRLTQRIDLILNPIAITLYIIREEFIRTYFEFTMDFKSIESINDFNMKTVARTRNLSTNYMPH